jgi:hypothetical protein
MYWHVTTSITSSTVKATRAKEDSATFAVRRGPETLTTGVGCQGPNGPGGRLGLGLGIRLSRCLGVK